MELVAAAKEVNVSKALVYYGCKYYDRRTRLYKVGRIPTGNIGGEVGPGIWPSSQRLNTLD